MKTEQKITRGKPPTCKQLEQGVKEAYEVRLAEIDFLVHYNDLRE